MSGRALVELFDTPPTPQAIDSWEPAGAADLDSKVSEANVAMDLSGTEPSEADDAVAHLVALGYVDPWDAAASERLNEAQLLRELNHAISLLDAEKFADAISHLQQVAHEHPEHYRPRALLAEAYFRAHQRQAARQEIDSLLGEGIEAPRLYYLLAAIELADRRFDRALEDLGCARRAGVSMYGLRALEGDVHLRRQDLAAAEAAFRAALAADGPTPQALDGLATLNLRRGRYEEAAVHALDALAKDMRLGRAHFHLAVALFELGRPNEARRALETWATVEPQRAAPYRWLARICESAFHDRSAADAFRSRAREIVRLRHATVKSRRAADTSVPSSAP